MAYTAQWETGRAGVGPGIPVCLHLAADYRLPRSVAWGSVDRFVHPVYGTHC